MVVNQEKNKNKTVHVVPCHSKVSQLSYQLSCFKNKINQYTKKKIVFGLMIIITNTVESLRCNVIECCINLMTK